MLGCMLEQVARLYFAGQSRQVISQELGVEVQDVDDALQRIDAVVLLLVASFPPALIPRAARMDCAEVSLLINAAGSALGGWDKLREFAKSRALEAPQAMSTTLPRTVKDALEADFPINAEADEALDALDFWTSKWE